MPSRAHATRSAHRWLPQSTAFSRRRLPIGLFVALALGVTSSRAIAQVVIPQGKEGAIQSLFEPYRLGDEISGGYAWMGLRIEARGFTAVLERKREPKSEVRLEVVLRIRDRVIDATFATSGGESEADGAGLQAAARLQETVQARAGPDTWRTIIVEPASSSIPRTPPNEPEAAGAHPARPEPEFEPKPEFLTGTFPAVAMLGALALLLMAWVAPRIRKPVWRVVAAATGLVVGAAPFVAHRLLTPLSPTQTLSDNPSLGQNLERALVAGVLAAVLAALGLVATWSLVRVISHRSWRREGWLSLVADVGLVAGWSLFVRFGLTTANVLTDGGSGWGRLVQYRAGFSGVAVLVDFVLPDATMLESITVPRFVAALAAPLLVLIARELELDRATRLLAGFAMASWPLHAALYASDFANGAIVSLALLGLWLVMWGRRQERAEVILCGLLVTSYMLWGRPETLAIGLPLLMAALPMSRAMLLHPAVLGGAAWLLSTVWMRLLWMSFNAVASGSSNVHLPQLWGLPLGDFLSSSAVAPAWVWLSLPLGLLPPTRRGRLFMTAFLVFAAMPFTVTHLSEQDGLEFVRYGTSFLVLLALASGLGWSRLATWAASHLRSEAGRQRGRRIAVGAVLAIMVVTPLAHREYLARRYGPTEEIDAFTKALAQVPPDCGLVVPDDGRDPTAGTLEVEARYIAVANEIYDDGPESRRVMGFSRFLDQVESGEVVPGQGCWTYFEGVTCFDAGNAGTTPAECVELNARFEKTQIASFPVEYRSHRLLTRPDWRQPPMYMATFPLTLWRLRHKASDAPTTEEARR